MITQLLLTFTKSNKLQFIIDKIAKCYTLPFNKLYILENLQNEKELICSYNIDSTIPIKGEIPPNTISVHRRKTERCIYTINALNYAIALLNDGKIDSSFPMPWEKYKNCILVTNTDGLKKIETKLHSIVEIINDKNG